jgi:copper chaperone
MAAVELVVRGMSCGHCVKAVTAAIQAQDRTARVEVDLPAGRIRAETSLSLAALTEIIAAEGYAAA